MSHVDEFTSFHPQLHTNASSTSTSTPSASSHASSLEDSLDALPKCTGFVRHSVPVYTTAQSHVDESMSACEMNTLTVDVRTLNAKPDATAKDSYSSAKASSGIPPILFVHGLASNMTVFSVCAEQAAAQGHAVAMMSLRGHLGSSQKTTRPVAEHGLVEFSIKQLAYDVLQVLRYLAVQAIPGWNGCAVCVGHSYGGNVVVELASMEASREVLAGIICVDGGYINLPRKYKSLEACCRVLAPPNLSSFSHGSFVHMVRTEWMRGCEEGVVLSMLRNFVLRSDGSVGSRVSVQTHMALLRELYEHPPSFAAISVPVIFAPAGCGESNAFSCSVKEDVNCAMAALQDAGVPTFVQWFPESSHDIPSQQPQQLMNFIHEMLTAGQFTW